MKWFPYVFILIFGGVLGWQEKQLNEFRNQVANLELKEVKAGNKESFFLDRFANIETKADSTMESLVEYMAKLDELFESCEKLTSTSDAIRGQYVEVFVDLDALKRKVEKMKKSSDDDILDGLESDRLKQRVDNLESQLSERDMARERAKRDLELKGYFVK